MTTHLYCVVASNERVAPTGLAGLSGEAVRALAVDNLVAWVSDVSRDIPLLFDGLRAHDAVVQAALDMGTTPVPARFGQRFNNDDACRAALASRAASVESLLAGMQGYVEMTLIITPSTKSMIRDLEPVIPEVFEPDTRGTGRKYLETLRRREMATGAVRQAIDALALRLNDAVAGLARRVMAHDSTTPLPLRTISHLVARGDLDAYRSALADVPGGREFRFLVIGPRAPYSFSALTDAGGAHGMKLAD